MNITAGTKELRISQEDRNGDKQPDTVYFGFYQGDELVHGAAVHYKTGKVDVDNNADLDGDKDSDKMDEKILVDIAKKFVNMGW